MTDLPFDLEDELRLNHANRAELGLLAWRNHSGSCEGRWFSYEEVIAIAALLLLGWDSSAAATLVDQSMAIAVPYISGLNGYELVREHNIHSPGLIRLSDASTWEVFVDPDIRFTEFSATEGSPHYQVVATRGLTHSAGECVFQRINHLMSFKRHGAAELPVILSVGGGLAE
jgi:hypothetical protein